MEFEFNQSEDRTIENVDSNATRLCFSEFVWFTVFYAFFIIIE